MRILLTLLAAAALAAQTAKVVPLEEKDSQRMQALAHAKGVAIGAYEKAIKEIERKYVAVPADKQAGGTIYRSDESGRSWVSSGTIVSATSYNASDPCNRFGYHTVPCLKKQLAEAEKLEKEKGEPKPLPPPLFYRYGFEGGFEFSDDYRFIVPKSKVEIPSPLLSTPIYKWGGSQ
jgi:hypothetical protein